MIPHLLRLLLEKADIFPSEDIIKLVEKESTFAIPKFLDVLIDLAYDPISINDVLHEEAKLLLETLINSSISFEMLRYLFELQGPNKDRNINSIKGNTLIKALPDWKQKTFDCLIRRISSKNQGIRHLMLTLMDMLGNDRSQKVACDIAKCICRPPFGIEDQESHYRQLSIQIIDLLKLSSISKILTVTNTDKNEHSDYLKFSRCVALECVHLCARINKQYAQKYLLDVLLEDFYRITNPELVLNESDMIILQSEELFESLNLHYSLLNTFVPSLYVQNQLRELSCIYINIATLINDKDNKFKSLAHQIIVKLIELSHGSAADTLNYIKCLVALDVSDKYRLMSVKLSMRHCLDRENIEVALAEMVLDDETATWNPSEELNMFLMTVLSSLSSALKDDIVSQLFLWLLECHFNVTEKKEVDFIVDQKLTKVIEKESKEHLLSLLCAEMESHCFTRRTDILKLGKIVILRYGQSPESNNVVCNDHLNYALSMIVCVLESGQLDDDDKAVVDELYPLLAVLRDSHPLEKTRDLATDISIIIATHGHVNFLSKSSLIDEVDDGSIGEELKEAFDDINSTEVPLKAHGIVVIYKLLKAKNESAIKNRNKIYNTLSQLLFHPESFIYLRAISALSVIGSQYTEKMLPMIAQRIRACRGKHSLLPGIHESSSLEDWMKLSEVFMKIINNLGETAPMYRDVILSSLLTGLRDEEEIIRASSLSNLAELCCQIDYILTSVIYEVVNCVCEVLVNDRSALVKNAASLFIRRLLLGKHDYPRPDIMQRFPGDVLLTIQRSLKTVLSTETDDSVLDHVSVAYKSLDDSVRLFVCPPKTNPFEKKVQILELFK